MWQAVTAALYGLTRGRGTVGRVKLARAAEKDGTKEGALRLSVER